MSRYHEKDELVFRTWEIVNQYAAECPKARSLHAGCLWQNKIVIFGGFDGFSRLNDVYSYHLGTHKWKKLIAADDLEPNPIDRHTIVLYNDSFITFGGFDGISNTRINSCFQFHLKTRLWKLLQPHGNRPNARHSHAAAVFKDAMYIYGGYDGTYCADMYRLDLKSLEWSKVDCGGESPSGRYRSSCIVYKDSMIVHGGHDGTTHLSSTYIFNFSTNDWTRIHPPCEILPTPRDSHSAVVCNSGMYIFGGSNGSPLSDCFELDLRSFTWKQIHYTMDAISHLGNEGVVFDPPSPSRRAASQAGLMARSSHEGAGHATTATESAVGASSPQKTSIAMGRFCHVGLVYDEWLYVFGGFDGHHRLNDLRRYRLVENVESVTVPPSTLLSDLKGFINNPVMSDATFLVDGRSIYAHKILCIRFQYFFQMMTGGFEEGSSSEIVIKDIEYSTFIVLLEFIYCDAMDGVTSENVIAVFQAADRFRLERLRCHCENLILSSITVEVAATVFQAADLFHAENLKRRCLLYILANFDAVSQTEAFEEMGRSNMELVFEVLRSR